MEKPYAGRAIINDLYNGIEIIIPAKKNWFIIVFLCIWLCLWLFVVIFVPVMLLGLGAEGARLFMYFFLCLWAINGFFAVSRLWWYIGGKEVIRVSEGTLTIDRRGAIFKRAKSYELAQCNNFRAVEETMPILHFNTRTTAMFGKRFNPGTIKFDYLMEETIQFGDELTEPEGNNILARLRAKKLISDS